MGLNYKSLKDYSGRLSKAIDNVDQSFVDKLEYEILKRIDGSYNIYLIGNGGSAGNAHHIVGDFSKTFAILLLTIRVSLICIFNCHKTSISEVIGNNINIPCIIHLTIPNQLNN